MARSRAGAGHSKRGVSAVRVSFDGREGRESFIVGSRELAEQLAAGRRNARIDELAGIATEAATTVTHVSTADTAPPSPGRGETLTATLEQQLSEPSSRRSPMEQPLCLRCGRRPRIGDLTLCWCCKRAFDAGGWR